MQRFLWMVIIAFSSELSSNNLLNRNQFHQSVQSQEFETFEDDGRNQADYQGDECIGQNYRLIVAGIVFGYSFAVTLAILNAHAICMLKFYEPVSKYDAVCCDY